MSEKDYEFHTKTCSRCKVEQHLYFFRFVNAKGAPSSWCKQCEADFNTTRKYVSVVPQDDGSTKFCVECGETKSISEYYFNKRGGCFFKRCKTCANKRTLNNDHKRRFGIDAAWREKTLMAQDNKCAICKIEFNTTNLGPCVDHDASNNKTRGILCNPCNILLGLHQENCETLRAAGFDRHAEYLERYKRIHQIKLVG